MILFCEFVVMLERHFNIQVYIIYTDFSQFNFDGAAEYFSHKSIIWDSSIPNEQQQNEVAKRHIQTVIEEIRAQMVDAKFLIKLWAEFINIVVYIKNRLSTPAAYEVTMTLIQDFYCDNPPNVDHINIFGFETYIFNESNS